MDRYLKHFTITCTLRTGIMRSFTPYVIPYVIHEIAVVPFPTRQQGLAGPVGRTAHYTRCDAACPDNSLLHI